MDLPEGKRRHTREDSGIRLDRHLRWWHDDEEIRHPGIIETFNVGLRVTDEGRYRLEVGQDWCFVEVEDAAFEVRVIDVTEDHTVRLRLSDRTGEALVLASLQLDPDGVLSCRVKNGRARARFSRDAQYALGAMLEEGEGGPRLSVGGRHFPLPGLR